MQFLSSEIFTADEIIGHLLAAAGDPRHSVSDQGDHQLKQFSSAVNWDSPTVIGKLFSLYQGTVAVPGKRPSVSRERGKVREREGGGGRREKYNNYL
jgi:hypothetical protein